MKNEYAVPQLIERRRGELDLSRAHLARKMGYANVSKGMRRLDAILGGDTKLATELAPMLAAALDVDPSEIEQAIGNTRQDVQAEREKAYRESFRPYAILMTEREVPYPHPNTSFFYRPDVLRWIELEEGSSPETYVRQVLSQIPETIKIFGKVTGFSIKYSPDHTVEFNKDGRPIICAIDNASGGGVKHH